MKGKWIFAITIAVVGIFTLLTACDKEETKSAPLFQEVKLEGSQIGPFTVVASILDDNGELKSVKLFYKVNTATTFSEVAMTKATDVYKGTIPVQVKGDKIYYYVEATNSVNLVSYFPEGAPQTTSQYEVAGINYSGVVINEIWAGGPTDADKFIELFNKTTENIDISGVYFERNNEGKVGEIPAGTILQAGKYYMLGTKSNTSNPNGAAYDNSITAGFSAKKTVRFTMFSPSKAEIDKFLRGTVENLDASASDMSPKSYSGIPNGTGAWKAVSNQTGRAANDATGAIDIPNN